MSDAASDLDLLEARLVSMRNGLIARLVERVNGGDLALLGSVGVALMALDGARREAAVSGGGADAVG